MRIEESTEESFEDWGTQRREIANEVNANEVNMAMKLADVVEEMKRAVQGGAATGRYEKILELAADFLVPALVKDTPPQGQAAFLMVRPEHEQLTFTFPRHLANGNVLPIDRESFAGRVVLQKEVLIENNAAKEVHKDVFERIPGPSGAARTIQKMLAAPILGEQGEVIGVVEISRTGATGAEAGLDFSAQDGENLRKSCRIFAPFIAHTWAQRDA